MVENLKVAKATNKDEVGGNDEEEGDEGQHSSRIEQEEETYEYDDEQDHDGQFNSFQAENNDLNMAQRSIDIKAAQETPGKDNEFEDLDS